MASAEPFTVELPSTLPATGSAPFSIRELARALQPAVYIVAGESRLPNPSRTQLTARGFGTGVLLYADEEEYLIATNRHVVDGEQWQRARPSARAVALCGQQGGVGRAEVAGWHKTLDLLLLRGTRSGSGRFVQPVLAFSETGPGEPVVAFGHPQGLYFSLSSGLISRIHDESQMQITAPVGPGSSGGPVYDLRGRLLGIVASMLSKATNPQAENVNFAIRADAFLTASDWQLEPAGERVLAKFLAAQQPVSPPVTGATPEAPVP